MPRKQRKNGQKKAVPLNAVLEPENVEINAPRVEHEARTVLNDRTHVVLNHRTNRSKSGAKGRVATDPYKLFKDISPASFRIPKVDHCIERVFQSDGASCAWSIKDFDIIETLGSGTFGEVMKVTECKTQSKASFAIKKISKTKTVPMYVIREIKCHHTVSRHKNIIGFYGVFWDDDFVYLVLELAKCSLHDTLQQFGPCSEKVAALCMSHLGNAIDHCQTCLVLHRDIKPANIVWGFDGNLKLADFGSSVSYNRRSKHESVHGTAAYMPQEVLQGQKQTLRVDIWAAGCTFVELFAGCSPYEPVGEEVPIVFDDYDAFMKVMDERITDKKLNAQFRNLPAATRAFALEMISKKPEDRLIGAEIRDHKWVVRRSTF